MPPKPKSVWPRNRSYLFVGMPGTGKSTACDLFVDCLLSQQPDAIALIHDPHGSTDAREGSYKGQVFPSVSAFRNAASISRRNVFRMTEIGELAALAVEVASRCPVILVIDEADMAVKQGGQFVDDSAQGRGALYRSINYGRQLRISLVGTARRASRLGTDWPANAESIFLFRLSGHTDIAWVQAVCDKETAAAVAELPRFQGILYDKFGSRRGFSVSPTGIQFAR